MHRRLYNYYYITWWTWLVEALLFLKAEKSFCHFESCGMDVAAAEADPLDGVEVEVDTCEVGGRFEKVTLWWLDCFCSDCWDVWWLLVGRWLFSCFWGSPCCFFTLSSFFTPTFGLWDEGWWWWWWSQTFDISLVDPFVFLTSMMNWFEVTLYCYILQVQILKVFLNKTWWIWSSLCHPFFLDFSTQASKLLAWYLLYNWKVIFLPLLHKPLAWFQLPRGIKRKKGLIGKYIQFCLYFLLRPLYPSLQQSSILLWKAN